MLQQRPTGFSRCSISGIWRDYLVLPCDCHLSSPVCSSQDGWCVGEHNLSDDDLVVWFCCVFFCLFSQQKDKKKSKAHILVCPKKFCSPIEVIVQQMIVFLCLRVKPWYRHPVNQSRTVDFLSCTLFSMVEMSASLPLFSVSFFPHIFDYKNILSFTPSLSLSSNMPVPHSYGKTLLSASFSFMLSKQRT